MKLLMLWLGDIGIYWGHLLGLLIVGIAAYFLFDVFKITKTIEGEKQSDSFSQILKKYPGRAAVLVLGIAIIIVSEKFRS